MSCTPKHRKEIEEAAKKLAKEFHERDHMQELRDFQARFTVGAVLAHTQRKAKIELHTPRGNAPTCPDCGNWNALLDRTFREDDKIVLYYECRDCGWLMLQSECKEVIPDG
ncbi:MAG: hypothetical protein ACWGQW_03110 [bacterium]